MSPDIGEIREPLLVRSISRKAVDGNCEAAGVMESVPCTRDEQVMNDSSLNVVNIFVQAMLMV